MKHTQLAARFTNDIWPFNPKYPNGWRGEISLRVFAFGRTFRVMYFPAKRQNDWMRVDYASIINISPTWAKWFHFNTYCGIAHLTIGHVSFSILRGNSIRY